jgi:cysteine desulfurase/selenocysteine lyase
MFIIEKIRQDFPILQQTIAGKPLVYLDNAATTQKPQCVLDAITAYYEKDNANIHRGVHTLSERATQAFETTRTKVQRFINAAHAHEIIFVSGTTEAINLVAQSYGRTQLQPGDEIIVSHMEHHSNIVPWQIVCEQTGAHLRVIPINQRGELQLDEFAKLLNEKTRLAAITHISNALGSINPIEDIITQAHAYNIPVLIDGAQAAAHMPIDVQALDCDFYAFSGHKLYGPTGIGVLYGKEALLEKMPPYHGGGEMINQVAFAKTTYNVLPYKFEAGTPHIEGVIGLGASIDYLQSIGLEAINKYEQDLLQYATAKISAIPGIRIFGEAKRKSAIISFTLDNIHAHDVGTILDHDGIAIRTGHHCAMPVMTYFGVPATARASFALYNTHAEIDALIAGLYAVKKVFQT